MFVGGIIGGLKKPIITYADQRHSTPGTSNNYTYSSVSYGAADPTRHLLLIAHSINDNNSIVGDVTGITIDGVGMTKLNSPPSGNQHWTFWMQAKPSGTSGTIVANRSVANGFSECSWSLWACYFLKTPMTPVAMDSSTGATDPSVRTIATTQNGIASGMAWFGSAGSAAVWTNLTKNADALGGASNALEISAASLTGTPGSGGYVITVDSNVGVQAAAISFR